MCWEELPISTANAPLPGSDQRLLDRVGQFLQSFFDVNAQVHAQQAPTALGEHLEIASSLCGFDDPKSKLLSRHSQVLRRIRGNLEEKTRVGPAFVRLSRGMQEARTKSDTGGRPLSIANPVAHRL